jgi:hypothetical protein
MNYKSDNGDNGRKSLEREFAERVELIGYSEAYDELIALITTAQRKELMGDPSTIVTFIEGATVSSLVKGDIYKLIQTVFGRTTEEVSQLLTKEIRRLDMERTIEALIKADKKLREAGIDPKRANLDKVLLPLIQAISLEDDSDIQEIYQNLLTAAFAGEEVGVSDLITARSLESNDVLFIDAIYKTGRDRCQDYELIHRSGLNDQKFKTSVDRLVSLGIIELTALEDIDMIINLKTEGLLITSLHKKNKQS